MITLARTKKLPAVLFEDAPKQWAIVDHIRLLRTERIGRLGGCGDRLVEPNDQLYAQVELPSCALGQKV